MTLGSLLFGSAVDEVEKASNIFVSGSVGLIEGISSTRREGVFIGRVRVRRCSVVVGINSVRRCCSIWSLVMVFDDGSCSSDERTFFRFRGVGERERTRDLLLLSRCRRF